ncbi:bifunctional diguanylate cyclase/phosphodiesterase [Mesorhizobium sp. M7A.F.Ca.CA.001.09.2.1]|uniref:EAL domain-containing protein n=10 Tax=Mesorhizobium TaxID=68287 RepID=A0AB38TCQ1_9HYPH|nr:MULTISPECIES: bifunctional diguanylate cyclase/phosphodiesterase [Mesorhizobium]RUY51803.1 bifunctional diguanylate cyclase/phosphodiesterase [Mesorhizobium sp. M7A.F.Ca.CA.001.13.2.1]MDF3213089.1 EAL domain-containing protein [Mesorhizobium ciceri]RUY73956.1 bifunctional diguanylate cyclase/phosphodiesterase [Mesorhizobium sp. M7A.F.Ca.CA.001.05.1.1]RUY77462.1 bifunctional diguanylate cyclase/phosphodiesterase [Mesorhizobium sp. M7A.F.Ca.CA.001.09.2.1]RUZ09335.1 bifunctional diguanylate cy
MRVISCIATEHNLWLVLLAALMCVTGCWVTIGLFDRSRKTTGVQMKGWLFLTAVAAGSSIWCTHFIAMLAYQPGAPITFDPVLTMASLVIAIVGTGLGFTLASGKSRRLAPEWGGVVVGLAISAMHYTGMMAYHVAGIVEWDGSYVVASLVISAVFSALAVGHAVRRPYRWSHYLAIGLLVLAIVGLHFTAMAAVAVTPLSFISTGTNPDILVAMAVAVAVVGLIVAATGFASYLIDERGRLESFERLQHLALNDALTGLANRVSFNDRLDHEIERAREDKETMTAVIVIDLDRFKEINDLRGHAAGDQALKIVARRLAKLTGDGEFVARLGGDEFAAIKRFKDQKDLLGLVSRLEKSLFEPLRLDDFEIAAGASIGVAVYPRDGADRERLVSNADLAMYRAKNDVTRAVCFYESAMDETARARRALATDLRQAIDRGELSLHYQVQTSVQTGATCGYEALLRWTHPVQGMIPPAEFIPIAEENGSIMAIGEWVLRTACRQAASWDNNHKIAVNLSPVQFAHADLAKLVHQILVETGLSPKRLELELTESTIVADKVRTLHVLRQIKALGVTIAIDDFGTGYSSLDTLRSFPFDKIKLDRSFMADVERSPQAKAIIRAVLTLGRSLDIPVLAEGVETHVQLTILQVEGCNEAQGYFLGRPKPIDQITGGFDVRNYQLVAEEPARMRLSRQA